MRLHYGDGNTGWLKVDIVAIASDGPTDFWLTMLIDATDSERVRRRSQALMSLAQNLARNVTNYQATLHTLAQQTAELVGDGVLVTMLSADGHSLQRAAHYHRDPVRRSAGRDLFAEPYPATEGPAGQVIKTGRPLRVDAFGVPVDLDDKYAAFARDFGIKCFVIVPLLAEGRILGTLGVSRERPRYTDDDVEFLQSLADTTALTVMNARLQAEASQRLTRLVALHQSERAVVASLDLRLTLQVLLDQIRAALTIDAAAIFTDLSGSDGHDGLAAGEHPLAASPAGVLPRDRKLLTVPLVSKGKRLGSLELFNRLPFELDYELSQFLETLVARAASAIETSWLAEQAARQVSLRSDSSRLADGRLLSLTAQQRAILRLLGRGKSNREIAYTVKISENTVKFHLREIFRKLGVRNRVEAARLAP